MFTPIISGLSFYDILAYFVLYAVVGYMLEVIFAAVVLGKFVNRGFLNGPWCPIYGFGVVIVAVLLKPISQSLIVLFIGSTIVTSLLEYFTGFVLERVFHQKWWDYSDMPFNLSGYICLKFSLVWGLACTFVIKLVLPATDLLLSIIPHIVGLIVLLVLIAAMLADLTATIITIAGIRKKLRLIEGVAEKLRANSDNMGEFLSRETLALKEKYEELEQSFEEKRSQRRILAAFPNLRKVREQRVNETLAGIRERLREAAEKGEKNLREAAEKGEKNLRLAIEKSEERSAERQRRTIEKYETALPEGAEKPFAYSLCFTKLFWLFMIGNVVGFVLETVWALLTLHHFEVRVGLVWGPFIPVYGFGAVVMTLFLYKSYKKRDLFIFTMAALIGGAFEFLCSLFQELAFGTVSWEYSDTTANLGGRTNLMYALIWGVLGLLWVKEFFPFISRQIERIPKKLGNVLTIILCVFMLADITVSGAAVIRRGERMDGIPADTPAKQWLDRHFDDEYLDFVFPNMIYVDHTEPDESASGQD